MPIKLLVPQHPVGHREHVSQSFQFSGGEIQLSFPDLETKIIQAPMKVVARLQNPQDLVELILATEILKRKQGWDCSGMSLCIPYLPYGRQDRVMHHNEAFSLKAIAGVINSLGYGEVITFDCHSDVSLALINNITHVSMLDIVTQFADLTHACRRAAIVSPDAGAAKKVFKIARELGRPFIGASKVRSESTGELTRFQVMEDQVDENVVIFDDICDGGRTFIELARRLRDKGAKHVSLYVTHGIFSKGLEVFDDLIDKIYTTNTFASSFVDYKNPKLVLKGAI